jgi:hypothetical protein
MMLDERRKELIWSNIDLCIILARCSAGSGHIHKDNIHTVWCSTRCCLFVPGMETNDVKQVNLIKYLCQRLLLLTIIKVSRQFDYYQSRSICVRIYSLNISIHRDRFHVF